MYYMHTVFIYIKYYTECVAMDYLLSKSKK